jgi:hypothetical protein
VGLVYRCPPEDLQKLNPGWGTNQEIPAGTKILIPDPDYAPLLAARFSAEALVSSSITNQEKVGMLSLLCIPMFR